MCQWAAIRFVMAGESALHHETTAPSRDPDALALVVCGLTRHQRAYVADGFRRSSPRFVDTYDELDRVLPTLTRCDAFVLAIEDSRGRSALATAQRLAREWPDTAMVV